MAKREFEWATVVYERSSYDVCVAMYRDEVFEVDEIRPIDSEIDITPVMDVSIIDWMFEKAKDDIEQREDLPYPSMTFIGRQVGEW
jgi:hypothetical protein